jgi:GNAT superfamily N-acetyltransferase
VIELTEEPYDTPVATALVAALHTEIGERYADEIEEMTEAEQVEDAGAYLAEVTPETVTRPHGAFVVAWLDGQPVGCGAVQPLDGLAGVAEVKRMYSAPWVRRRGVSRRILTRLEEVAIELGYRRAQLETGQPQPEAIALYESAGWVRITPYGHYKDSALSVCFGKDLGAP